MTKQETYENKIYHYLKSIYPEWANAAVIAKALNINAKQVGAYMRYMDVERKQSNKLDLFYRCDTNPYTKPIYGRKPVKCNGVIYESITECSEKLGIQRHIITKALSKQRGNS